MQRIVRYRARLVALRSGLKAQVHAVLAKEGVKVPMSDLFGVAGQALLDTAPLGRPYELRGVVASGDRRGRGDRPGQGAAMLGSALLARAVGWYRRRKERA